MAPPSLAALVNVVGFLLGAALYGLLLGTVLRTGGASAASSGAPAPSRLLLLTGLLGLTWNLGSLWIQLVDPTLRLGSTRAVYGAAVGALGFLPAVVVHSVLAPRPPSAAGRASGRPGVAWIVAAYGLSATAALVEAVAASSGRPLPAPTGLWLLTGGFVALVAVLLLRAPAVTRDGGRPLWVLPLSIFAVSALHLSQHTGREAWPTELLGHHASLPLAVAILLRDYRFALADIFLKRALSLTLVMVAVATVHATVGLRWLPTADVAVTTYLLVLVLATVLLQEPARAVGAWIVDSVVLRRPDTSAVVRAVEAELAGVAEPGAIPVVAARRLGAALDAAWIEAREIVDAPPRDLGARVLDGADAARFVAETRTRRIDGADPDAPPRSPLAAIVAVPTVDAPRHVWCVGPLTGGRRWLSDDVALAESVAFLTARRLDGIRVADERYAAALRERQIGQLATEAELRALRAQLNPHFLFNALTTIGYLIQVAPAKAQSTLMRLTSLLRGVLRRSTTEFSRLGDEIALVQAYLEIEEARFEERLRVRIAVDASLHDLMIPSLLLQPLVENAVKHGIAPLAAGGDVEVRASLDAPRADGSATLHLVVRDSGVGHAAPTKFDPPGEGLGLANVEQRLRAHFGDGASLTIDGSAGAGTVVRLSLPVRAPRPDLAASAARRPE